MFYHRTGIYHDTLLKSDDFDKAAVYSDEVQIL